MQIVKLRVGQYKCLVDFVIHFSIGEGGSSSVLIGENGTGKSTLLRVVSQIIMSFDSDAIEKEIDYEYELEYEFAGERITIERSNHSYQLKLGSTWAYKGSMKRIRAHLAKERRSIFPRRVVAFYSGTNDSMLPLFRRMERSYLKRCRSTLRNYVASIKDSREIMRADFPRRKYNYCLNQLTDIYLCSILAGRLSFAKEQLQRCCHINERITIDVAVDLRKIKQFFPACETDDANDMPQELAKLIEFFDPNFVEKFERGFKFITNKKAVFSLDNLEGLGLDSIAIYNFFEKLASLLSAQYRVYVVCGGSRISVDMLSEGQRQLIKVLGMLGVCKEEDCMVLMDEPDSHMNPKWKYSLKETIDGALKDAISTQAIIATHDPLVINGVDKKFIHIFSHMPNGNGENVRYRTKVDDPIEETKGMGIDGLLQSEYYGLNTSYDKATSDLYEERLQLYIKLINQEISETEKERLRKLTRELGAMPFSYNTIDFLYDDFIKEFRNSEYYVKPYLSFDEIVARREKIKRVLDDLFKGQL